jgi:hypothetical protein
MLANKIVAHTSTPWAGCRSCPQRPPPHSLLGLADPMAAKHEEEIVNPLECGACCPTYGAALVVTPGCLTEACNPCRQLRRNRGPADVQPLPLCLVLLCQVPAGAPTGKGSPALLLTAPAASQRWARRHTGRSTRQAASAMSLQTWLRRRSQSSRHGCAAMGSWPCCKTTRCCAMRSPSSPCRASVCTRTWLVYRAPEQRGLAPHRSTCWSARLRPRRGGRGQK